MASMSERFKVTKSEEAVLFRNYGATGTTDDDSSDGDTGKIGEPHVVIGTTNNSEPGKEEEEDRDGKLIILCTFCSLRSLSLHVVLG